MIRTVNVTSPDELAELVTFIPYREDLHRFRSHYIYRGVNNTEYSMVTSLRRNCGDKQQLLEPSILKTFAKYAENEDPTVTKSVWHQMILGQHYGLPTRLLDWTHSSLVSLHFSTEQHNLQDTDRHDSIVWRIDYSELKQLLPGKYRDVLHKYDADIFTLEMLHEAAADLEEYDRDMGSESMVLLEPPSINERIINQYSFFAVVPMGITDVGTFLDTHTENTVRYVIDRKLRWQIRDLLDSLNMSERIVYPGLEGLARWIRRYYFVRDLKD